jgi:trigger factor
MQVTETSAEGLKREYKVVIAAEDLAAKLEGQLEEMKDKVRINGFRPGKVPKAHLKRLYGRSIMGEVLQNTLGDVNKKIVEDNNLRLAGQPRVDFAGGEGDVEKALDARGDLAFTVAIETLPQFDVGSFADVAVEKLVADVPAEDVDAALNQMADRSRPYADKAGDAPVAENGDKITIDFIGRIDGEAFEGGAAEGQDLVLGSNSFIPGFEEQLVGIASGETRTVKVSFPENYAAGRLAGKPAEFEVTAKVIAAPGELALDDAFAKNFSFDSLDAMKTAIRGQMEGDFARASRERVKRRLLDALDTRYSFDLPQSLVEQEFSGIWNQLLSEQQTRGESFSDEGTTEEAARAEYQRIAERRVRLGLVLAEVGEKAGIKVEDNEVTQAVVERARAYPGQEKLIWDYYQKNPDALAEVRAPIFEEKVIDKILADVQVTERKVDKDELFRNEDDGKAAA